jgi:hypothetical protein
MSMASVLRRLYDVPCLIQVRQDADRLTVSVVGRLEQMHVADLVCACAENGGPVILNLMELVSADRIAIEALHRLRASGVELLGLARYLQFSLDDISRGR